MKTLLLLTLGIFSFMLSCKTSQNIPLNDNGIIEFQYPGNKHSVFTMTSNKFKKFDKEWRGDDYYYSCFKGESNILCSVLYFKLNEDELRTYVRVPAQIKNMSQTSPYWALNYFSVNSNTKRMETNEQKWGNPTDDFMFRQVDIVIDPNVKQKNMFGYATIDGTLFADVHLSKMNCTANDSIEMRKILESLRMIKQ